MTIIFRCNASPSIGFGHLTRCRALAHTIRQQDRDCIMVGPDSVYAKAEDNALFEEWISVDDWKSSREDAALLIQIALKYNAKWLVLDDYRIDEAYQLALRVAGLHWLQFDGFAKKPIWSDIVINANPGAKAEDYADVLRNPKCKLLLGPKYAVLRQEFLDIKPRSADRPVRQVLVTFGGGDDRGAIQFVLKALLPSTPTEIHFVVVSGMNNPNNDQIVKWVNENGDQRVSLFIEPDEIAQLFAACDLAVVAGGTTTYEVARCGLPMVLITIAENQMAQALAWTELGAAIDLGKIEGISSEQLIKVIQTLLTNPSRLYDMRNSAQNTTSKARQLEIVSHFKP